MTPNARKYLLMLGLATTGWLGIGADGTLISSAEAIVGRPATPVSYAGVARRSTVGVGAPGVGVAPVVGVGVGVGVGVNMGGPVNRVGVR